MLTSSVLSPYATRRPGPSLLFVLFASVVLGGCGTSADPVATDAQANGTDASADTSVTDGGPSGDAAAPDAGPADAAAPDAATCQAIKPADAPQTLGDKRPAKVFLPDTWDGCKKWPLIILLHGYTATGTIQNIYLGIGARVSSHGFVLVLPEGTKSKSGKQFWDATDACCNFEDPPVDDVTYLRGLIKAATAKLAIDPERVYLIGHSNGGFMAYRMACEVADLVAGVASLAGAVDAKASACTPSRPVNILQMHGTADATIKYGGGGFKTGATYPSAETGVGRWVGLNKCTGAPTAAAAVDFDNKVAGAESVQNRWGDCAEGTDVGLWKMTDSGHIPSVNKAFKDALVSHVLAWRRAAK